MGILSLGSALGLSAFDGAVGAAQQHFQNEYNSREAEKNRNFQREERLQAQEYNTEMWNKTNEYNSIGAQLERAKEAGVSPNAIIGQGGNMAFSGPTSSPMSGNAASSVGMFNSNIMANAADIAKADAERRNIESDTSWNNASLDARLDFLDKQIDKLGIDIDLGKQQKDFLTTKNSLEIQTMTEELNLLKESLKASKNENEINAAKREFFEKHGMVPGLQEHEQLFQLLIDGKLNTLMHYLGSNAAKVATTRVTENGVDLLTGGLRGLMQAVSDFMGVKNPFGRTRGRTR